MKENTHQSIRIHRNCLQAEDGSKIYMAAGCPSSGLCSHAAFPFSQKRLIPCICLWGFFWLFFVGAGC